ncbi:MAG TPA: autotransporter-associated beta strand repeat-containing protein [Rhizomicrobium sp.]|jgi:autotransporter-associated beta strand protein|nr:autotransporter-associated beta strand repeat-containing protein [Rhizomicrobium sp.]
MTLRRRLLLTTAYGLGILVLGSAAEAQTIGEGQTVNVSTLSTSSAPTFQGGTLEVDRSGTYANNFFLGAATTSQPANMIDAHGNAGVFSGIVADATAGIAGNLTILDSVGGGTVTFSGINTYTGPTTINSGATFALSGSGSLGFSQYVLDSGTLDISGASAAAQIFSLSGAGNVTLGSQTLTIIDAGVSGNNIFTGTISGAGSLSISGGIEILDGANTYTGGTTITSGGALQIGNDDTAGSVTGNISNAGSLTFARTDNIMFSSTISGAGNVNEENGTLTFTTAQTYTGPTSIISGALFLSGSGSIAGSSTLTDDGNFDISATSGTSIKQLTGTGTVNLGAQTLTITAGAGIFSGVISGTGVLVLSGGNVVLSGTNTYTGGTTVTAGTLQIGGGATTGTVVGNITDNGTVAFDYAGSQAFTSVISGTGAMQVINGTLVLSTAQTYTGLTTITAGALQLLAGADISASSGLVANGTFDISATSGATIQSLSGTGIVQLGSQTLTIGNPGATSVTTFSGLIESTVASGAASGGVTVAGGTLVLSGTSTYTGTTTISGGTLSLTSLNSLAASPIMDNATLDISSAINNLSNIVTVNVSSLTGSGMVTLGSNTLVITDAAGSFSGTFSGVGNLTISGGTETLTGANTNTFSGTTTIASGATLVLSGNGSLPASTITADGTLDMSGAAASATFASLSGSGAVILGANSITLAGPAVSSDTLVAPTPADFSGAISGTGGLTVSGGTQILSGANTYTGGTSIASGATLQMGDGTTNGTILGNIADAGTLAFDYSGSSTIFSGTITGAGGVNQMGGTAVLTATNTYSGGTTITAGTLQIGNGGTTGSITGDVTDNGTLAFDRSDNLSYGGAISGRGGVTQLGTGTLILSGADSYTGVTTIGSGSALQLAGGNSLATSSNVADNGLFDVSVAASPQISSLSGSGAVSLGAQTLAITNGVGSFSGVISGTGGVTVSGGTQAFAGTNSYSGATTINGGTLAVTGSIASSSGVAVNSGGTLAGTGTVSGVTVASGGTIAPGSGGSGTLNVNGSVSFANGSTYLINASSSSYSSMAVSGSASLGGTLAVDSTNGTYLLGQKMTVLTATSGVNGSFTAAALPNSASGAQFASLISQDANNVYVTVNLSRLSPALASGSTLNQTNAVAGIDAGIAHGDSLPQAFENLGNISSSTLGTYAQQMAGELGADIAQVGNTMFNPFQDAVFDHLADIGNQPRGVRHAALQSGPEAWFAVLAGSNIVGQDVAAGAQKFSSSAVGLAGGADWHLSPNLILGGALSLGSTHFHAGGGMGEGKATAYQLGIYGLVQYTPRIYGSFLGAFGSNSINATRSVTATETDALSASPTSKIFDARYETGVNLRWIEPYIAIEDRLAQSSAYTESGPSGANSFALSYGSHNVNTPDVEIGLRNSGDLPVARNWVLHLTDGLAFEHAANGSFDVQAAYAALPDSNFTTFGAQPGKNLAKLSLGAEFKSRYGLTAGLTFDEAVSSRSQSYNGVFSLGYGW